MAQLATTTTQLDAARKDISDLRRQSPATGDSTTFFAQLGANGGHIVIVADGGGERPLKRLVCELQSQEVRCGDRVSSSYDETRYLRDLYDDGLAKLHEGVGVARDDAWPGVRVAFKHELSAWFGARAGDFKVVAQRIGAAAVNAYRTCLEERQVGCAVLQLLGTGQARAAYEMLRKMMTLETGRSIS